MNSAILSIWTVWDEIYQRCTRLQYVEKGNNIFRIVLLSYHGELLTTKDGTVIESGDFIVKLHIHNCYFAKLCRGMDNDARIALLLRRHIKESLPPLATLLAAHPCGKEVKGLVGTTMLYKGVEPLGFTASAVPDTWFFRYKRWYLKIMMMVVHPDGVKRVRRSPEEMSLKRVFMSRDELFSRYLYQDQGRTGELDDYA